MLPLAQASSLPCLGANPNPAVTRLEFRAPPFATGAATGNCLAATRFLRESFGVGTARTRSSPLEDALACHRHADHRFCCSARRGGLRRTTRSNGLIALSAGLLPAGAGPVDRHGGACLLVDPRAGAHRPELQRRRGDLSAP